MKKIYTAPIFLAACFLVLNFLSFKPVQAQALLDIGLFQKDATTLEVRIRPTANTNPVTIVSNIQFTIRWDNSTGTTLGFPTAPLGPSISLFKAGAEEDENTFRYQKFTSLGFSPLPSVLTSGTEYVIGEISVTSTTNPTNPIPINNFQISSDQKTINFNGEFYAELGGLNRTGIIYQAALPFPIELLDFTAEKMGAQSVLLKWATAAELNNDRFEVEKKGVSGVFEVIGTLAGQGTSSEVNNYELVDDTYMAEVNYYRLKQVDVDGSYTYSKTVEIRFPRGENDLFLLYPSPAISFTVLKAVSPLDGDYRYYVSDVAGKTILHGTLAQDAVDGQVKIDVSSLPSGTYYVRSESPLGQKYINRLVKR